MPVPTTTCPLKLGPRRLNAAAFSTTITSCPSDSRSFASDEPTRPHPTMRYLMSNERPLWKGRELRPAKKREFFGAWLSLVERFVRDEEVARSNRVAPKFPQRIAEGTACSQTLTRPQDACFE